MTDFTDLTRSCSIRELMEVNVAMPVWCPLLILEQQEQPFFLAHKYRSRTYMWISFPIQDRLEQPGANSCLLLVMASSGYQLQFKIFVQVYLPLAPDEPEDQNFL